MKIIYRSHDLEELANGKGDHNYPLGVAKKYRYVLHHLSKMNNLYEARKFGGRKAERKQGDRADQFGVRLNQGWRVMFKAHDDTLEVLIVRELTNHYN